MADPDELFSGMDPSKLVTSWCVGNIWGLYSIIVILLGVIASISAFPTGSVITQASLADEDQSLSDSSSRPVIVTHYVGDLQRTLNSLCEDFVKCRFGATEPPPRSSILSKLPNISGLLPNKILTSEDLPSRMWIHYRILHLFNRSMDNIIFDENQNNASYNFGTRFYNLQRKIERVLAGILETIHNKGWEENESVIITHNMEDIFKEAARLEILRSLRAYTVLSFFNRYLSTLYSEIHLL